jgi:hypothetical protein
VLRILSAVLVAVLLDVGCGSDDNDNGEATAESTGDDNDNGEATAEFTGDGCVYSGPTEFEVGDQFEVTVTDVTEERMDVGFAVWKVPDGMTADEFQAQQFLGAVADDASGTFLFSEVTEEDTERVLTYTLDEAGTWVVNCFLFGTGILSADPGTREGANFAATTFEVAEQS